MKLTARLLKATTVWLATLGVDPNQIIAILQGQNAVTAAGTFETASDRIVLLVPVP